MGMSQEAIISYQRAVQARPDYAMAYGEIHNSHFSSLLSLLRSFLCAIVFFLKQS
jgi:hypothetical protein